MIGFSLRKAVRDLIAQRAQTLLVFVSIATGLTALGMVLLIIDQLEQRIAASQESSRAAAVRISLGFPVDDDTIVALARIPMVSAIDAVEIVSIYWQNEAGDVQNQATVTVMRDFGSQTVDTVQLVNGRIPEDNEIAIESVHSAAFGMPAVGESLTLIVNDRPRTFTVSGTVHSITQLGSPLAMSPAFFVSREMQARLGLAPGFSHLNIAIDPYSTANARQVADTIEDRLEAIGVPVLNTEISDPQQHILSYIVDGIGFILRAFAIVALLLSVIIIVNTMNALLARHVAQIAVMKTYGATFAGVQGVYLLMVLLLAVVSLLIALPAAALLGNLVMNFLASVLNLPKQDVALVFSVPAIGVQVVVGVALPLIAAWLPVRRAAAATIRDAVSGYGVSSQRQGKAFAGARTVPLLYRFIVRNTGRRPLRTLMTGAILMVSGALFITVRSTDASFLRTMDTYFGLFDVDISLTLQQNVAVDRLEWLVGAYPDVTGAEVWLRSTGSLVKAAGDEQTLFLSGYPVDAELYQFRLTEGRLPSASNAHELLLNHDLAHDLDLQPGDTVPIDIGDGFIRNWVIAGLVLDLGAFPAGKNSAMLPREVLGRELDSRFQGNHVYIQTSAPVTPDFLDGLRMHLNGYGVDTARITAWSASRQESIDTFQPITVLLLLITVLVALVGNVALSGLLSINVLERRREIGVMRSIGATSRHIGLVFLWEAVVIAILSSVIAIGLSLMISPVFVSVVMAIIDLPESFTYDWMSVFFWLIIATLSALVASWLPARHAMQVNIRDSIAYE